MSEINTVHETLSPGFCKNYLTVKFVKHESGSTMNTEVTRAPMTVADRCDRCTAQAHIRVYLDGGSTLQFCGHHFHEHEDRLRAIALDVQEQNLPPVTEDLSR